MTTALPRCSNSQVAGRSLTGTTLTCLYISGNLCISINGRAEVLRLFPNLQQLDDEMT